MLASSSNFFTANVIIDRITWECILYYMESEEFIKIAKNILGEEKYNEYKLSPQGNARIFKAIWPISFPISLQKPSICIYCIVSLPYYITHYKLYHKKISNKRLLFDILIL